MQNHEFAKHLMREHNTIYQYQILNNKHIADLGQLSVYYYY